MASTHFGGVPQRLFSVPLQKPVPLQTSFSVLARPSSHGVPAGLPTTVQLGPVYITAHWGGGGQFTVELPEQTPFAWHTSFSVLGLLSLHGVFAGAYWVVQSVPLAV